jgi:hypothetical protein
VLAVGLGACGLYSLIDERIPKTVPPPFREGLGVGKEE